MNESSSCLPKENTRDTQSTVVYQPPDISCEDRFTNVFSISDIQPRINSHSDQSSTSTNERSVTGILDPNCAMISTFMLQLNRLATSKFPWRDIEKSTSPKLRCSYGSTSFLALIDSGAEVNVLDKDFAISLNIEIIESSATAQAANRVPLQVYGQTSNPINLKCEAENGTAMLPPET